MWLSSNKTRFYISLLIHINIWVFWGWCKDSNEKKVNKTSFWLIKNWLSSNQIFGATIIVTVGIFYLDCIANDTGQDIIQQETSPLENLTPSIKKGKLKKTYGHIRIKNLSIAIWQGTTLGKRIKRGRQRGKMGWQSLKVDRKIIYRDSDIGMQARHMEEASQVLSCAVTLWPHPVMGLLLLLLIF